METLKKLSLVLSAAVLAMALAVGPAFAAAEGDGGGEAEKIQLAQNQHEFVGLILLGFLAIGGLAALLNARKQLRGERKQATGEFRWR